MLLDASENSCCELFAHRAEDFSPSHLSWEGEKSGDGSEATHLIGPRCKTVTGFLARSCYGWGAGVFGLAERPKRAASAARLRARGL